MNMTFHLIVGSLATVFFLLQFKHTKLTYQLLLGIWTPLTFLTYVSDNQNFQIVLGVVQLLLFFLVLFFLFRARKIRQIQAKKDFEDSLKATNNTDTDNYDDIDVNNN